jgi:kynureninase
MRLAEGAWRWLNGTPPIPALYAAIEGPRIIARAGIDAIRAKSTRQTTRIVDAARERGWRVHAANAPERRAGTVALDVPNGLAVKRALAAREILTDYRPGAGLRMAPHFYTSDEEIDAAIAAIDEILSSGAWRGFGGVQSTVT